MRAQRLSASLLLAATALARAQAPDRIAGCESLLVSQQAASANRNRPFLLHLTAKNGATLMYFGVRHTFDPADTQLVRMRQEFEAERPTLVFFEGSNRPVTSTADAAVRDGGEPGLARFLAHTAGVSSRSLEPSREAEVTALLKRFSAEDLLFFYTLRPLEQLRDRAAGTSAQIDSAFARQLAYVHRMPGLSSALLDTTAFRTAFVRRFPTVDMLAPRAEWFNPRQSSDTTIGGLFNSINYASSAFRDEYMYRELSLALADSNARVFAEVGRDHIPAQAAALRCAMEISEGSGARAAPGDRRPSSPWLPVFPLRTASVAALPNSIPSDARLTASR